MIFNKYFSKRHAIKEHGQGLIEYALILVLIIVACIGLFYGGQAAIKWYQGRNSQPAAPAPAQTQLPVISSDAEIQQIVETGKTVESIETETTTTNNCFSSTPTEIQTQRSRSIEHLVVIEGQAGVAIADIEIQQIPFLKLLKVSVEGKYGVQDKQTEQRSYTITFSTNANKFATHTVSWKYTWYLGEGTIKSPDGAIQVYKYKVRAILEPEITSIEQDCSQIPISTPSP